MWPVSLRACLITSLCHEVLRWQFHDNTGIEHSTGPAGSQLLLVQTGPLFTPTHDHSFNYMGNFSFFFFFGGETERRRQEGKEELARMAGTTILSLVWWTGFEPMARGMRARVWENCSPRNVCETQDTKAAIGEPGQERKAVWAPHALGSPLTDCRLRQTPWTPQRKRRNNLKIPTQIYVEFTITALCVCAHVCACH